MKLSVRLSTQSLLRMLRGKAHDLAERVERGRRIETTPNRRLPRRNGGDRGGMNGVGRG